MPDLQTAALRSCRVPHPRSVGPTGFRLTSSFRRIFLRLTAPRSAVVSCRLSHLGERSRKWQGENVIGDKPGRPAAGCGGRKRTGTSINETKLHGFCESYFGSRNFSGHRASPRSYPGGVVRSRRQAAAMDSQLPLLNRNALPKWHRDVTNPHVSGRSALPPHPLRVM